MTPAQVIADLDQHLADHGQAVTLRRYGTPVGNDRPKTDIAINGFVRAIRAEEMVGAIEATASNVTISPTGIGSLLPLKKGDKLVIDGRERNVELPKPKKMADMLVRIDLVVAG